MKKPLLIFTLFACLSGWYSCTKDTAIAPQIVTCDSTKVSYTKSIKPIMSNYCAYAGCHDGGTAGANDLTNYIGVKSEVTIDSPNISSILCRIQTTTCGAEQMPKGLRPLRAVYIDTIKLWKTDGYCN